jgi:signal peptidase
MPRRLASTDPEDEEPTFEDELLDPDVEDEESTEEELEETPAEGEDAEEEEEEQRPLRRRRSRRQRRRSARRSIRPWSISDLDDEEVDLDEVEEEVRKTDEGLWAFLHRPVFYRARDSWYFEPLVALAIIVVLLSSLFAYTSNWPPVYVVESQSMQHGAADTVGLINAGDLVLIQKVAPSEIVTYVVGAQTGFRTYGEFGDVILYYPFGDTARTPVIHRAILYLVWNASAGGFDVPSLAGLPCGTAPNAVYSVSGTANGCGWTALLTTITLYGVGWQNATVSIPLGGLGHYAGFITMGDNNTIPGTPPQGKIDQVWGISGLVAGSSVVGVARGMLPWVGAFKLLIEANARNVPPQSWEFLALTISALVLAGFGLHYLFRVEGIEDPRRLAEEKAKAADEADEDEEDESEEGPPEEWHGRPKGSRWRGLRAWLEADDEEPEEEPSPPKTSLRSRRHHRRATRPAPSSRARGRPRPAVRKSKGWFHRKSEPKSSKRSGDDRL